MLYSYSAESNDLCEHSFPVEISRAPMQCPAHAGRRSGHSDALVLDEINGWFRERLPCVAGRREFNRQRYMIKIATAATVPQIFGQFVSAVRRYENTACFFVFNQPEFYPGRSNAHLAFRFLAEQMAQLGVNSAEELADGAALSNTVTLPCPVTGIEIEFDDFECIAFCPQSSDLDDPLYDPLMSAPYPAVNLSSDVFAFSYFVLDACRAKFGKSPSEISNAEILAPFFNLCVERWQKIAVATIGNFAAITDTSRCPVHLAPDADYWVAAHQDPAFAETVKIPHRHELPTIYARRISDAWLDYFANGRPYSASGQAREGMLQ
jgi:hypothetical protein